MITMILQIEERLRDIAASNGQSTVSEAIEYSLLSGGKRLRPNMLLGFLSDLGGDVSLGLDAACALEMIHTYSLVHDDLPAMDDDDFRRFKPTNHKVYGEGMAILAGDGLLTQSFSVISNSNLDDAKKIACIQVLSQCAGTHGMILGQEIDTADNIRSIDDLIQCYELKTGKLFAAALEMAVIIAGKDHQRDIAHKIGLDLGIAFQYQDDLLEAKEDFETIGKSNKSDLDRNKHTVVSLLGLKEAEIETERIYQSIRQQVQNFELQSNKLLNLIESITGRRI